MTTGAEVVAPTGSRVESSLVGVAVFAILVVSGIGIDFRQVEDSQQRLFDWQVSAFHDLNAADQAIYNALLAASEELWWLHGDLLNFGTEEQKANPWPTVEFLDEEYLMPPFTRDMFWSQHGEVEWRRVASFSFEGSAVYFGSAGGLPGQSAYLLRLSHVHKGASYTNGATVWIHSNPTVEAPDTVNRDSLIANGWEEVVPYSGEMEVERLKG